MRRNRPGADLAICWPAGVLPGVGVRPAGPIAAGTGTSAATAMGAGGQAAGVAAWITALGGRARLIAARAVSVLGAMP